MLKSKECISNQSNLKFNLDLTATSCNAHVSHVDISIGMVELVLKYLSSINKVHLCLFSSEAEKAFE